ncbi:MAG TPA: adenylosuccinate lyase, partial [Spirochaetia bacterium]|nr:adenylosuccinate lyase [Spirochaetia bacterium]
LSPLDHRYLLANREEHEKLAACLSESATIRYCTRVELALLETLVERTMSDTKTAAAVIDRLHMIPDQIDPEEVYREEEKTRHNIRALVNVLKKKVPSEISHLVHLGATSVDILDTAFSMRVRDAVRRVVLPLLIELEKLLISRATDEADTPEVGRTHGQFAVPITYGFALAEYVARLGKSIVRIEELSADLRGKLAGAVGAYNALSMITDDPESLERRVLEKLGLTPSEHATQLVEPEHLLRLLLELNTAFGVIANLADDLRNLSRSEIGEVREEFAKDQVGSSTMPQKRNPWNAEHVKSLWKTFAPRVVTFFMDQISEHQRDLTNSASQRFIAEYIAGFTFAAARMKKIITTLGVIRERMEKNLAAAGDMVLAEPAYILLALAGDTDAHETVRKASLAAEKEGIGLGEALRKNATAWERLTRRLKAVTDRGPDEFFSSPQQYTGKAAAKTRAIASSYAKQMQKIEEVLK